MKEGGSPGQRIIGLCGVEGRAGCEVRVVCSLGFEKSGKLVGVTRSSPLGLGLGSGLGWM